MKKNKLVVSKPLYFFRLNKANLETLLGNFALVVELVGRSLVSQAGDGVSAVPLCSIRQIRRLRGSHSEIIWLSQENNQFSFLAGLPLFTRL